jgi:hypothetical protein
MPRALYGPAVCDVPRKIYERNHSVCGILRSNFTKELAFRSIQYWQVVVGIPQYVWARNAKGLRRSQGLWHSAEIWARNLAKDWIPVPAILHWQLPCLLHHNILTHDFPAVKPWRGKLFRPKLSTQGLIWNSILWHYTFKDFDSVERHRLMRAVLKCVWIYFCSLQRGVREGCDL